MHTCIPSHGLTRSRRSCPRRVNAGNKNTPSMHHLRRRNVTTSVVGLKTATYAKISPKMVNPRNIAGKHRRRRRKFIAQILIRWNCAFHFQYVITITFIIIINMFTVIRKPKIFFRRGGMERRGKWVRTFAGAAARTP